MLKQAILATLLVATTSTVFADQTESKSTERYDFDSQTTCQYKNDLYTVGAKLIVGDSTITCVLRGKYDNQPQFAHWG